VDLRNQYTKLPYRDPGPGGGGSWGKSEIKKLKALTPKLRNLNPYARRSHRGKK